ncbi:MAG: hypothetical protein ACYS30_24225, partial [Planctomycetota bacterium]
MGDVCRNIREQIPELITGALTPERAAESRRHINQCQACSEYLQALQADDKLLGDFAEAMLPTVVRLEDKVIEALGREPSKQPVRFVLILRAITRSSRTKVAAAAVIIVTALIGVRIFTGRVGQERPAMVKDEEMPSDVFVERIEPEVEAPREDVAIRMRESAMVASDAELEAELWMVRELIAAGDIDGLAAMLERGRLESRIVAANYLAKIGDPRGIAALEELPGITYVGGEPNSLIAMLDSIAERLADPNESRMRVLGTFVARKDKAVEILDGKDVVVRLYKDWRAEPGSFEKVLIRLERSTVSFDLIKLDPNDVGDTVVAVFGEDQSDVNVAEAMGDYIYAELYKKGLRFSLSFGRFDSKEGLTVVFHDAFDANTPIEVEDWDVRTRRHTVISGCKPIPEANVVIFLRAHEGPRIQLGKYMLDEEGSLPVPRTRGSLNWFDFVVSHPEYGTAMVSKSLREEMTTILLPLVRRGSVAADRAVWGTIVDPQGNPVAGATIACREVRTLGEGLINPIDDSSKVISDVNGFFTFYMPNKKHRDERGVLVPPKSRYYLIIEAPQEYGLLHYSDWAMNGQDTTIIMEWGDYLRTFVFEDDSGLITDPERLKAIHIIIERKDEEWLRFRYNDWKDGGRFPLGTYQALLYRAGEPGEFEPLEVTEDSPEQLIFRLSGSIFYHGRVIHGLTDEPMEGVFVIA